MYYDSDSSSDSYDDYTEVYTDGACINNGRFGAMQMAGIGVWFGDGHYLNVSEPIPRGYRTTNQVAEILAVEKAAEQAKRGGIRKLKIITDSKFIISCVNQWIPKWQRNGWKTADGRDVVNQHELRDMLSELDDLDVKWIHVAAHANIHGNEMADMLAKQGAARYR